MILSYLLCVIQGRFLLSSSSNISIDSCSDVSRGTNASNANHLSITSTNSEQYNPNGSSSSPVTVEEVSSKFITGESDKDRTGDGLRNSNLPSKPEVSLALRKLAAQLSLEDDDDKTTYFREKFSASNGYGKSCDFGTLNHETRESLLEARENQLPGWEYWEHNQSASGKQEVYGSTQMLNVSGTCV